MAFQYILMKYAYLVMVGFFSVLFVYNLFTQKSLAKQIGCAILLIPFLLRLFLPRRDPVSACSFSTVHYMRILHSSHILHS